MEKEFLKVKNFGPIKELDIEIKPLMVFIGESGSGKSAILKLMSLLRWVHKQNNLQAFNAEKEYKSIDSLFFENLSVSEIKEFVTDKTRIEFIIDKTKYKLSANSKFTFKKIKNKEVTFDKVIFLTENRGILPYVKDNKFSLSVSSSFPYYFRDTYDNFNEANKDRKTDFKIESTSLVLFNEEFDKNKLFIKDEKGKKFKIELENSSSGTKTALPIELIVNHYTQSFDFEKVLGRIVTQKYDNAKNLSIFIEEPELCLFPAAQRRLINRLIKDCFVDNKQKDCTTRLAFATHSPYILTSLNNLLLAGEIVKENSQKSKEIEQIIPKEYWLTIEQFGAYSIENGEVKSIIDIEENLINGIYLDNISDEIATEFSQLLEIQYGN